MKKLINMIATKLKKTIIWIALNSAFRFLIRVLTRILDFLIKIGPIIGYVMLITLTILAFLIRVFLDIPDAEMFYIPLAALIITSLIPLTRKLAKNNSKVIAYGCRIMFCLTILITAILFYISKTGEILNNELNAIKLFLALLILLNGLLMLDFGKFMKILWKFGEDVDIFRKAVKYAGSLLNTLTMTLTAMTLFNVYFELVSDSKWFLLGASMALLGVCIVNRYNEKMLKSYDKFIEYIKTNKFIKMKKTETNWLLILTVIIMVILSIVYANYVYKSMANEAYTENEFARRFVLLFITSVLAFIIMIKYWKRGNGIFKTFALMGVAITIVLLVFNRTPFVLDLSFLALIPFVALFIGSSDDNKKMWIFVLTMISAGVFLFSYSISLEHMKSLFNSLMWNENANMFVGWEPIKRLFYENGAYFYYAVAPVLIAIAIIIALTKQKMPTWIGLSMGFFFMCSLFPLIQMSAVEWNVSFLAKQPGLARVNSCNIVIYCTVVLGLLLLAGHGAVYVIRKTSKKGLNEFEN